MGWAGDGVLVANGLLEPIVVLKLKEAHEKQLTD